MMVKRALVLFVIWFSFLILSYIYLEDISLKLGSGTLGIFYTEFLVGLLPLLFYLVFWGRKNRSQGEDPYLYFLRVSFGYLWILDALLQMQPGMNEYFVATTIAPSTSAGGITGYTASLAISLWNLHPVVFDVLGSLTQLYIGAILLTSNSGKIYFWTQILAISWGMVIWVFGEGFGGAFASGATILTGFPGSVLIYVYVSLILLLSTKHRSDIIHKSSYFVGALIFISALVVQLIPSNGYFSNMSTIYMQMPSPAGILSFANDFQYYFTHSPIWPDVLIVLLILVSVSGWLLGKSYGYIFSAVLAAFSWIVFQGLGALGILSTDLNTGLPLLIISIFFYLWGKKFHTYAIGLGARHDMTP